MQLGNFSLSLAVKDLQASKAFYAKLGFTPTGGDESQNWLVLKNVDTTIGLFQGMFEKNIITFNPGWDANKQTLPAFTDVRDIQQHLRDQGLELNNEADPATIGPAHITLTDPDGNPILIDQHVNKPAH